METGTKFIGKYCMTDSTFFICKKNIHLFMDLLVSLGGKGLARFAQIKEVASIIIITINSTDIT